MEHGEKEDPKEYRWETGYEKLGKLFMFLLVHNIILTNYILTREAIKEDDDGLLDSAIAELIQKAKRKRQQQKTMQNKLGMMRHMYLILDCSESILKKINLVGEPSLQNGLDLAMKTLKVVPSHASREILVIMGSLTTCDPIDITQTIETLKQEGIRCSVISLSAEIHVCRFLTTQTNGTYGAVLDDSHYRDQLLSHVDPPPAAQVQENSLIKWDFHMPEAGRGQRSPLSVLRIATSKTLKNPVNLLQ
ncbi:General transcription factor IIH subunit 2 [Eumeta japonica]|uniref:General transcription factor IIH subunit 2 n=1 Tax=Eumeta variegata TaxID=151549 RepID=A0A4C1SJ26_EUMVA|nr:General transcription factor IIH subunit 2 [Eumeta japonica]